MNRFDDSLTATQEALRGERMYLSTCVAVGSLLKVTGVDNGNADFKYQLSGLSSGRENLCMLWGNFLSFVRRVESKFLDDCLSRMQLVMGKLQDSLALVKLRQLLMRKPAEVESKVARVHGMEEQRGAGKEDSGAILLACAHGNDLKTNFASATVENEQVGAKRDTFAICVRELQATAATHNQELSVDGHPVWS